MIGHRLSDKVGVKCMCKLLMSINPEHVENILAGRKKFEFRKTKCKEQIDSIVIYSTG